MILNTQAILPPPLYAPLWSANGSLRKTHSKHLLGESELITRIQNNVPEACAGGLEDGGGGGQRGGGRGCDQEQLSIPEANVDDNSLSCVKE